MDTILSQFSQIHVLIITSGQNKFEIFCLCYSVSQSVLLEGLHSTILLYVKERRMNLRKCDLLNNL